MVSGCGVTLKHNLHKRKKDSGIKECYAVGLASALSVAPELCHVYFQVSIKYKGHTYAGSISLVPEEDEIMISSGGRGRHRHAAHPEYAGGKQEQ